MIGCGTDTLTDPEEFRARIPGLRIDLVLTASDAFRAQTVWASLAHLRLLCIEERTPRVAFVSLAPRTAFVSFPLRSDPPFYWNGVRLQRGEIVLHAPGERFHHRILGAGRWGTIAIGSADLMAYGNALLGKEIALPASAAILRPPKDASSEMLRLHREACRLAEKRPDLFAHHEVARALEQDLVVALVNGLGTAEALNHDRTRKRHAEIMARFEDFLVRQGERHVPAAELCKNVGVPERTLRTCCLMFLGRSPSGYARLRRLNHVRAALARSDPARTSIAAIAREHGFSEPGRFAISYRALFGETPSATLRRNKSGADHQNSAEIA